MLATRSVAPGDLRGEEGPRLQDVVAEDADQVDGHEHDPLAAVDTAERDRARPEVVVNSGRAAVVAEAREVDRPSPEDRRDRAPGEADPVSQLQRESGRGRRERRGRGGRGEEHGEERQGARATHDTSVRRGREEGRIAPPHRRETPIPKEPSEHMNVRPLLFAMLVFVPASFWLGLTHASPTAVFVVSCLAVLPLAGFMGEATEHLAHRSSPAIGGLLNATFGNAAELIIGFMALRAGETEIVKASLTGSILGNMLMVLGLAMLVGGLKHKELRFSRTGRRDEHRHDGARHGRARDPRDLRVASRTHREPDHLESISLEISVVLILTYVASLLFSLWTHQQLFAPPASAHEGAADARRPEPEEKPWSLARSFAVLLASAVLIGFVSEFLVGAIHEAGEALGLGKVFMGVVVIAVIGNAAEHSTAVMMAAKNKMDLAFGIAMGSSMQIALFVAPVLVIAGHLIGQPLGLEFTLLEVAGGDALGDGGRASRERRPHELVRGRPAPRDLHDPRGRVLLHLGGLPVCPDPAQNRFAYDALKKRPRRVVR